MVKCAVYFSMGSELTVVTDLGGLEQTLFAAQHPHLSTEDELCTLCLRATVPFLYHNNTNNNIGRNTNIPIDH